MSTRASRKKKVQSRSGRAEIQVTASELIGLRRKKSEAKSATHSLSLFGAGSSQASQ